MTTYGLTSLGFAIKRLADILEELKTSIRDAYGADGVTVVTGDETGFGILAGVVAKPLAELWELLQAVYASQYPSTASGAALDNVLELANLRRLAATPSTAWQILTGDLASVVPSGSVVEHEATGARFATTDDVTLSADLVLGAEITVASPATNDIFTVTINGRAQSHTATAGNTAADVAAALVLDIDPSLAVIDVDQTERTFTVDGDHRDHFAIGKRCRITGGSDNDGIYTVFDVDLTSGDTVITVLEAIPAAISSPPVEDLRGFAEASSVSAVLTLVGYDLPDGASDAEDFGFSLTVAVTGTGTLTIDTVSVPHLVEAVENGPTEALVGTLTVIATGASGWTSTENVIGADVGNLIEPDVDARQRRTKSLAAMRMETRLAGLSGVDDVVVHENDTGTTDSDGRPGHSIECLVTGGDPHAIAQMIYDYKPAGIETYGNSFERITDSQGHEHIIEFSRATDVDIYVGVTVNSTYSEEDLPTAPSDAIADAIVAYGAGFVGGKDVISQRIAGAIMMAVPGLESITVLISKTVTPTVGTTITIADSEVARFDADRITVSGV